MNIQRLMALSLAMLFYGTSAFAQGSTLFSMDMSAGAAPYAGFNHFKAPGEGGTTCPSPYAVTRLATGGIGGRPAYRVVYGFIPEQCYVGWEAIGLLAGGTPAQGAERYIVFRICFDPTSRWLPIGGAGQGNTNVKFLMYADTTNPRLILHMNTASGYEGELGLPGGGASDGTYATFDFTYNIGAPKTGKYIIRAGQCYNVQLGVKFATTASSNDGWLKAWYNNDNEASPNGVTPPYQFNPTTEHDNITIGRYLDNSLGEGRTVTYTLQEFAVNNDFHPSWNAGGGGSGSIAPVAPNSLRLLVADLSYASLIGLVVAFAARRSSFRFGRRTRR